MLLGDIRHFLRQRGRASVRDIALHCHSEESAVEAMMQVLVRRGLAAELGCGGCASSQSCASAGPRTFSSLESDRHCDAPACNRHS